MASATSPQRVVLTTFGSLGDLHPYIAVALGMRARGHHVVLATSAVYREKILALGLGFRPLRPDMPDWQANPEVIKKLMHPRQGTQFVVRDFMLPVLNESYEDTLAAAQGADLLVSHSLTYTTRMVAEKMGIPWVSTILQPLSFMSAYDPPVLPVAPLLTKLRFMAPFLHRRLFPFLKWTIRSWSEPIRRLRADLGLPLLSGDPFIDGQHSPHLVLAWFSGLLGAQQPDWPPPTYITGFPFYDQDGASGLSPEMIRFLEDGPPPIVFTLGSTAVIDPGLFYEHSAAAAKFLNRRALLLVGRDPKNRPANLSNGVAAFDYAPFSELFPRAAVIVHQGGVGTTGQAMRSGRPMLVVPFAHDQPDNAFRVRRLGIARTIARRKYTSARAAAALKDLLENPCYAAKAAEVGRRVREEDGVTAACDALEAAFSLGKPIPLSRNAAEE